MHLFSINCKTNQRRNAFTLVEVLTVIIIIGLLAGLVVLKLGKSMDTAKINYLKSAISLLDKGIESVIAKEGSFPTITGVTPADKLANIIQVLKTKDIYVLAPEKEQLDFLAQQADSGSLDAILVANAESIGSNVSGTPTNLEIFVLPATPTIIYPEHIVLLLNDPENPNYAYSDALPSGDLAAAVAYYKANGVFLSDADKNLVLANLANSGLNEEDVTRLLSQLDPTEMASALNQILQLLAANELGGLATTRSGLLGLLERGINESISGVYALPNLLYDLAPWGEMSVDSLGPIIQNVRDQLSPSQLSALVAGLSSSPGMFTSDVPPAFASDTASEIYYDLLEIGSPLTYEQRKALVSGVPQDFVQKNNLIGQLGNTFNYDLLDNPSVNTYTNEQIEDFVNSFNYFNNAFFDNYKYGRGVELQLTTGTIDSLLDFVSTNPNYLSVEARLALLKRVSTNGGSNITEDQITSLYQSPYWAAYATAYGAKNATVEKFNALGLLDNTAFPPAILSELQSAMNSFTLTNAGLVGNGSYLRGLTSALASASNLAPADAQAIYQRLYDSRLVISPASRSLIGDALGGFLQSESIPFESKKAGVLAFPSQLVNTNFTVPEFTSVLADFNINGPYQDILQFARSNENYTTAHSDLLWNKIITEMTPANLDNFINNQGYVLGFTESSASAVLDYASANNFDNLTQGTLRQIFSTDQNPYYGKPSVISTEYKEAILNNALQSGDVETVSNLLGAIDGNGGASIVESLYGSLGSSEKQAKIDSLWASIQPTYASAVESQSGNLNGLIMELVSNSSPTKANEILDSVIATVSGSDYPSYLGSNLVGQLINNYVTLDPSVVNKVYDLSYADILKEEPQYIASSAVNLLSFATQNNISGSKISQLFDTFINNVDENTYISFSTLAQAPLNATQMDTLLNNPTIMAQNGSYQLYSSPNLSSTQIENVLAQFDLDPYTDTAYQIQENPNPAIKSGLKAKVNNTLSNLATDPNTELYMYSLGSIYNNDAQGLSNVYATIIQTVPTGDSGVQGMLDIISSDISRSYPTPPSPAVEAAIAQNINSIYNAWKNAQFKENDMSYLNNNYLQYFERYLTLDQKREMRALAE
jgi:prepilin-type N-terminal cleavage/methylation domain-containing protein